ncbi:hypothetical protein ACFPAF_13865 [Hymenobacter endophyticus]|uniref:Uncharacterized protein n=1 Tax=Hymenobacter endophyticus TaxID=3076335 RepID=A0ABU3TJD6_9BACT|nr:hypothetical protein [Hymenobacter endophyticus]MDU0371488.1 hypothetical protein [Hymenobacter endophyticus]
MFHRYLLAAALLLAAAPHFTHAQTTGSVGIGTTAPDASAALDIVSSSKGLLLPRVAATTGIASPAPGLLVYQTGAPAGFYYNAGDAAAPSWQQLATTGSITGGDNLGDHIATQNINLNGQKLVGGTTARAIRGGLAINGNGLLTVGAPRVHPDSTNRYGVRLTDLDQDFIITSDQGKGPANPISVSGAGDRMMWLSYYSAFRAGGVTGDRWNTTSSNSAAIGNYSAAFGLDN